MKILVYYHDDMDGITSAAIVGQKYKNDTLEFIPCQYDEDIQIKLDSDICFILDFSFSKDVMDILHDHYKENLIWFDHHISAIERLHDFSSELCSATDRIIGERNTEKSGCLLTWEWLNKPNKPPMAVEYADDYDRWVFNWGDESKAWAEMFITRNIQPGEDRLWSKLLDEYDTSYRKLVDEGFLLLKAKTRRVNSAFENGLNITFHGYSARAMNLSGSDFSQAGNHACADKGYDIGLCYFIKGTTVIIGLRSCSDDVDVAKLAVLHGGGGHKKASGFTTNLTGLIEILK